MSAGGPNGDGDRGPDALVDLHTHTICSDGLLTPGALVQLAASIGLRAISVTDHDSVEGIEAARLAGSDCGVEVLPGVELSASGEQSEIHVLGYLVEPDSPALQTALEQFRQMRYDRAKKIVQRLNQAGVTLRMDDVARAAGNTAIGRPHIAQALVERRLVASFAEAFQKFLRRGCPAFVAKERLLPAQAIDVIHAAGGVAVVAHPTYGPNDRELQAMVAAGLDGIEVRHPLLGPADSERFTRIAEQCKLVTTGGSDYHGEGRSQCDLGGMGVTYDQVRSLRHRKQTRG